MTEGTFAEGTAGSAGEGSPPDSVAWEKLLRLRTLESALDMVASYFERPEDLGLVVLRGGPAGREEARFDGARASFDSAGESRGATLAGAPEWTLVARRSRGPAPTAEAVLRAAAALSAWRASRAELSRSEARLRAGTRELALIESLGRRAAEARSPQDLFYGTACILQEGTGFDAVVAADALAGGPEAVVYLARPMEEEEIRKLADWAFAAAGIAAAETRHVEIVRLPAYDDSHGCRRGVRESDVPLAPLERRGTCVGSFGVLPAGAFNERSMRLFFNAANQVALHLDRILTVAAAEHGRFRSILDSMPQAVFLTDRSLRILQQNLSAERLVERLGAEASGGRLSRLGELRLGVLAEEVLEGKVPAAVGEAALPGGAVYSVTLSAFASGGGAPEGLVLVLADVTESRRLQAQLAQAEKLSSLGQMISGVAHELNNPLASVVGFSQLARATAVDSKLAARLETIRREAGRCQRIVRNLLSFARKYDPERKLLSLNEVVDSVLGLMAYQLHVDNVHAERDLDKDVPPIAGDSHQLQQAVLNLLSNAHQAIRDTGRGGRVLIRTRRLRPGWVGLEVIDDGPGIPESVRSRIFDPFFTTKAPGEGTGLGLSLVYGTVSAHGGTVHVESAEGGGATFRVELPEGTGPSEECAEEARAPAAGSHPARILVVDDEETVATFICEALATDGHRTESARDGKEALERLAAEEFDLVVADLRMPGMGGARLCEEMERMRPGVSARILLTTGDTVSRDPEAFARKSGVPVLLKPFGLDDLRRAVRSRLRKDH